jgi:hypothetical protein
MAVISNLRARRWRPLAAAAVLIMAGLGAGCTSTESLFGSSSNAASPPSSGAGDRLSSLVFGPPARSGEGGEPPKPDIDCPSVDIRQGASTLTMAPSVNNPEAAGIRYQASIARIARECALAGASMTLRVGVQGRVVLGPAGGPGQLDIPIRYAVVQEGVEPKTIESKVHRVAIRIEPGQSNVPFTHVAEDLSFVMPGPNALASYVIYVGFDPQAPRDDRRQKPQRQRQQQRPR